MRQRTVLYLSGALIAGWTAYLLAENWLVASVALDSNYSHAQVSPTVAAGTFRAAFLIICIAVLGCIFLTEKREWVWRQAEPHVTSWVTTLGCSAILLLELFYQGKELYSLSGVIEHPGITSLTGKRLLFASIAIVLHQLRPTLSNKTLILASQAPAVVFTTWAVGRWCLVAVGRRFSWVGQILLVFFLVPTIRYYTFYDVGIVGFYALIFTEIYLGRYWQTVPLVALATLNHENSLLLVPVIFACAAAGGSFRKAAGISLSALAGYAAVRLLLAHFLPAPGIGRPHLYTNSHSITHFGPELVPPAAILGLRWLLAAAGFRYAPPPIRKMAVFWPFLFVVTYVFGQLGEARQFNADIPYCIVLVLLLLEHASLAPERGERTA